MKYNKMKIKPISSSLMLLLLFPVMLVFFSSCSKEEGNFGNTTLKGKVFKQELGAGDVVIREFYSPEERVYLTYGDNDVYDDWVRTGFDGQFKFENLTSGEYQLYAYEDCDSCASGVSPVFMDVIIDGEDELVVPDLIITE